jgi:hypothetical protein
LLEANATIGTGGVVDASQNLIDFK